MTGGGHSRRDESPRICTNANHPAPRFKKNITQNYQTCHFKRKIQFLSGEGLALLPGEPHSSQPSLDPALHSREFQSDLRLSQGGPRSVKVLKGIWGTDRNQGKSPTGFVVSWFPARLFCQCTLENITHHGFHCRRTILDFLKSCSSFVFLFSWKNTFY